MNLPLIQSISQEWNNCQRCSLGNKAFYHVHYEIISPNLSPSVMMIGEGPGEAEDVIGRPFVGPAGRLLRRAIIAVSPSVCIMLANLLACRPQDQANGKNRQPTDEEIKTCSPRLQGLIKAFNPRTIVCLGRIPETSISEILASPNLIGYDGVITHLPHPSAILRRNSEELFQEYVRQMKEIPL